MHKQVSGAFSHLTPHKKTTKHTIMTTNEYTLSSLTSESSKKLVLH